MDVCRIFGTFVQEEARPTYGLTSNLKSHNPLIIAFYEWGEIAKDVFQKNITLKDRFLYLFGPPGWSHDGSRKTSRELRAELNRSSTAKK